MIDLIFKLNNSFPKMYDEAYWDLLYKIRDEMGP